MSAYPTITCLSPQNTSFVATTVYLSQQNIFVVTKVLSRRISVTTNISDKHTFVATKDVFSRDKHVLIPTKRLSRQEVYLWQLPPIIKNNRCLFFSTLFDIFYFNQRGTEPKAETARKNSENVRKMVFISRRGCSVSIYCEEKLFCFGSVSL